MFKLSIGTGLGIVLIFWVLHQMNGKEMQVHRQLDFPECEAANQVINGQMNANYYSEWLSQGCQRVMIAIVFDQRHVDARVTFWR